MYYIAICDNDDKYIRYIKRMLFVSGLNRSEAVFYEYGSGEELIASIKTLDKIDILILEMKLKKIDGNKTAKIFRKKFPYSIIVFCSDTYFPTVEIFEVTPFRYLLKKYTDERMIRELKAVIQEMRNKIIEPVLIGNWKYSTIKLSLKEILYISIARNGSYLYVNPKNIKYDFEKYVKSKKKLPELYALLKDYGFEYAHNSYIVNLAHIKRKTKKELELSDGTVLSVSKSKQRQLRAAFVKYMALNY